MAQVPAHHVERYAMQESDRGVGVTQRVDTDRGQTRLPRCERRGPQQVARLRGAAELGDEDEPGVLPQVRRQPTLHGLERPVSRQEPQHR